ncbi:BadF/BadG/BcrA/BcrD ATPase family protein [Kribbella qitaiheensis]|uniref:BadF/BadG/BcrA/BcrD ATPase family protein n=1 Tax=Kribbella qitaiheensis TaxID=1544730 RepID=UPI001FE7DDB6|nr:BadF/BadG/BcrA/BcrD ATPase family protein [Kribbella qitaiheensis]
MPASALVLGGDLGGTSTRIVIADHEGNVIGRGAAAGGNPTSHPASAAANFGQAIHQALDGIDPTLVSTAVIGAAGGSALSNPGVKAQFDAAWSGAGLVCEPDFIGDLEVAFASGTPEPAGTVLIAGTGSAARPGPRPPTGPHRRRARLAARRRRVRILARPRSDAQSVARSRSGRADRTARRGRGESPAAGPRRTRECGA